MTCGPGRRSTLVNWPPRNLLRLWRPPIQPGQWSTLGLFAVQSEQELEGVLASMPRRVWRTDEVTPLSPHPNDPAGQLA